MAKPIKVSILGDVSDLQKKLSKAEGDLDSFGTKALDVGKKVAKWGAVVGGAAAAVGGALYKVGSDFDDAYDTIRVGTGATGKALDGLQADFKAVVKDVPTDFASASQAIADLNTRTGATGPQLQDLSKRVLEMTRLTGGDLATNIASVTRVFGDWSIKTQDQGKTLDYLFKVSQTTGIGISDLSDKVVQFGAPLRQFGFSFEQAAALMGKWEKEGVNLETIMGGLRAGLGKLAKSGKEPAKAFQEVTKRIKDAKTTGEATAIAIETFGVRAGPDLASAVREGRFELDSLVKTISGSKETILGASNDTADFAESWQKFKNKVLVALEPIATRVFGAVGKAMDKVSEWWDKHGDEVMAGLDRLGSTIKGIGEAAKTAADWVAKHWGAIKTTILVVLAVLSPLLLLLALQFAAVGAAATVSAAKQVAAWTIAKAEAVKSAAMAVVASYRVVGGWALMGAQALINGVKIAAVWTAQIVASAVSGAASFALQVARVVGGWVLMGAQSLIQAARMAAAWVIAMGPVGWIITAVVALVALIIANWDTVKKWTVAAWDAVVGAVKAAWNWIVTQVEVAVVWVKTIISGAWTAIKTATEAVWNAITGAISAAWDWIKGVVQGAVNGVWGAIKGAWDWVVNATRNAWNAVTGAITGALSWVWDQVRSLPGKIGGVFADAGRWLLDVGKNLLSGLWNGIKNAGSWLLQKVGDFFGNLLPGWVKKMLGIHSPSTVFAELGSYLVKGLALGVDRETATAVKAAQAMATAVTNAMAVDAPVIGVASVASGLVQTSTAAPASAPGSSALTRQAGGGQAGGDVYHVNVNVQGGTKSDPHDIARETVWALKTSGR